MVEASNPHWLHLTSILDIQSDLAPGDVVDGHMGAPLCRTITCAGGGEFQEKRGMAKPV